VGGDGSVGIVWAVDLHKVDALASDNRAQVSDISPKMSRSSYVQAWIGAHANAREWHCMNVNAGNCLKTSFSRTWLIGHGDYRLDSSATQGLVEQQNLIVWSPKRGVVLHG
jgi:hypothetical protein